MTGSRRSALPTGGVTATRREMLRSFGLAAAAAAAAASACSAEQVADSGVDRLRFLNWNDYIDEGPDGTVARFERSTGVKVAYTPELNDNVEMYNRFAPDLRAGKRIPYDLLCPTFWMAERMLAEDLLDPLPIAELQNHANLDVPFLQLPWDRGARYQMPYQVVVAGIAYNEALTGPVNSMGELLTRSDLAGKVSVLSEMLDTVGLMLLAGFTGQFSIGHAAFFGVGASGTCSHRVMWRRFTTVRTTWPRFATAPCTPASRGPATSSRCNATTRLSSSCSQPRAPCGRSTRW